MSSIKFENQILELIEKRDKIPQDFWRTSEKGYEVIWLMSREDGSAGSYETSQERFGITRQGLIIWGFSSGCSCWSGWEPSDYETPVTYKEFIVSGNEEKQKERDYRGKATIFGFLEGWEDECLDTLHEYLLIVKDEIKPEEVFKAKNAEVRRYLMKRVGYDHIKKSLDVKIIHKDGTSELIDVQFSKDNIDRYVKVKDSSTDREYLLSVHRNIKTCKEAIAWTFNLKEDEYNPIIET